MSLFDRALDDVMQAAGRIRWGALLESFSVHPLTGAACFQLDVPISPGRLGFEPTLTIGYDSDAGNGPFGLGWDMQTPSVGRRALSKVPAYGTDDQDTFELDHDELVPALRSTDGWMEDRTTIGEYTVQRYRRRYEAQYDRIERWTHQTSGQTSWRSIDANNITSAFGTTNSSRLSDPYEPGRVARWLLSERYDDRGNIIRYTYVTDEEPETASPTGATARYLKRIQYANSAPHDRSHWQLEIVFDYGDHSGDVPSIEPDTSWSLRPDVFSDRRLGFEIRARRRCQRILMFHRLGSPTKAPQLVASTTFEYEEDSAGSLLSSVTHTGFIVSESAETIAKSLPAIAFGYSHAGAKREVEELSAPAVTNAMVDPAGSARWVDLHGEGLPGVLSRGGASWHYVRNLGGGRFADPEPVADVATQDALDNQALLDLALQARDVDELSHDVAFQPLSGARHTSDEREEDAYVGYIDLNGDNADDVVVADERVIRWYPSQGNEGFADPVVLRIDKGDFSSARVMHTEALQSFHIADMTGDGLYDLVRIRTSEVKYWPNLGRGRFGDPVLVARAPQLPDKVADGRVLLADLTGSGTNDLVWVGPGRIVWWRNEAGYRFGAEESLDVPGISANAIGTAAVDLYGEGAAGVAWIESTPEGSRLRYVRPAGGVDNRRLNQITNDRGLETRISYSTSTDFWLRDRATGGAWLTAVPAPVSVVERVETRDAVANTRALARYAYHHGYFDSAEMRFAGFAMVEKWTSAPVPEYANTGLFPEREAPVLDEAQMPAPTLTKTWRHTGTQFEDADLTVALKDEFYKDPASARSKLLGPNQMPLGQLSRDIPFAHRAMRGRVLREEIYGLDALADPAVPCVVREASSWVRQVQPGRNAKPAVFDVHDYELAQVAYEQDTTDPRIQHRIVLGLDEFGVVTQSVDIAYGRRVPQRVEQGDHRVVVTDRIVMNQPDHPTWHRVRVPVEESQSLLVSVKGPAGSQLFEPREIRAALEELSESPLGVETKGPHRELVSCRRFRYWGNDSSRLLSVGELESRALLARQETLVLTTAMVESHFGADIVTPLRFEGGYVIEEGSWWAPGPTLRYDTARFYLPVGITDAVGRTEKWRWHPSLLAVSHREDAFGNVEREDLHPRTLKTWRSVDGNGNVIARRFDALGVVLSEAKMGKEDHNEGDRLVVESLESSAKDDPTWVLTHDLGAGTAPDRPGWIRIRHRTLHASSETRLQDDVALYDGSDRLIGQARRKGANAWIVSDLLQFDANGNEVRRAQPFESNSPLPDVEIINERLRAGRRLTRDALGRVVRIENADGTIETFEMKGWSTVVSDPSDTILESSWYSDRQAATHGRAGDFAARQAEGAHYELRAAALSAAHAKTPATLVLDNAGNVIVEREEAGPNTPVRERRTEFDWAGRIVARYDARGLVTERIHRDLTGRIVAADHCDAGKQVTAIDATGRILRRVDPQGRVTRYRYDAAGRVTHVLTSSKSQAERLIERTIYGGGEVAVPQAQERNLIGRVHLRLSRAGLETVHAYDVNGMPTDCVLRPLKDHLDDGDWGAISEVSHTLQLMEKLNSPETPELSDDDLLVSYAHDALGRRMWRGNPESGVVVEERDDEGVAQIGTRNGFDNKTIPLIDNVGRAPAGTVVTLTFGNGVEIVRRHNVMQQLTGITATSGPGMSMQDLRVVRDARGSVMSVTDDGELVESFAYDAFGRMVRSEGLEPPEAPGGERPSFANSYVLDAESNLLEVQHKAAGNDFVRRMDYQADRNHIRAMSTRKDPLGAYSATFQHDDAGNMIHDPMPRSFRWDAEDQLVFVDVGGTATVHYVYDTNGELTRRVVERPGGVLEDTSIYGGFERTRRYRHGEIVFEEFATAVDLDGIPVAVIQRTTTNRDDSLRESGGAQVLVRYQLTDQQKSCIMELGEDAELITEEAFTPFGVSEWRNGRSTMELAGKRYGFRSARTDVDTQLLWLDGRWYSPLLGRWLNVGKKRDELNAYVFNGANPQGPQKTQSDHSIFGAAFAVVQESILAGASSAARTTDSTLPKR